jgi:hypothetical protein
MCLLTMTNDSCKIYDVWKFKQLAQKKFNFLNLCWLSKVYFEDTF